MLGQSPCAAAWRQARRPFSYATGTVTRAFVTLGLVALAAALAGPAGAQTAADPAAGAPAAVESAGQPTGETAAEAPRSGVTGLPLPRFVSLRAPQVNLRTGPGVRYPIDWVYNRAGLPLEVIDEFETWRRVRDWEGSIGWVHQSMLSGQRTIMVTDKQRLLRREPEPATAGMALLEPGVVAVLIGCSGEWCQIQAQRMTGWINRAELYGVYPDEAAP